MTLQVLRNEIGDQAFFRVLRIWAAGDGNRKTRGFIALAERVSGQQLDGLFETWLYTSGKPVLAATTAPRSQAGGQAMQVPAALKSLRARSTLQLEGRR